jgi:hypothetical protein
MGFGSDNQCPTQNKRAMASARTVDRRCCKAGGIVKEAPETAKLTTIGAADDARVLAVHGELGIPNTVREGRASRKQFVCVSLHAGEVGRIAERAVSNRQTGRIIIKASQIHKGPRQRDGLR